MLTFTPSLSKRPRASRHRSHLLSLLFLIAIFRPAWAQEEVSTVSDLKVA